MQFQDYVLKQLWDLREAQWMIRVKRGEFVQNSDSVKSKNSKERTNVR